MNYAALPFHMQEDFQRYCENHIPLGDFGTAVVCNNLKEACVRADDINRHALFEIVQWLYNEAPSTCWGSPEKVKAWTATRRMT